MDVNPERDLKILDSLGQTITIVGENKKGMPFRGTMDSEMIRRYIIEEGGTFVKGNLFQIFYNRLTVNEFICKRDNNVCYYCGEFGETVDHIVPKKAGGLTTPVNCVCACRRCNRIKGHKTVEQFKPILEKVLKNSLQKHYCVI